MTAPRRVRELRLTGADRRDLGRARHLVEDAFRTASLPLGRPGSVIVVHRLDLGTIDLRKPSQTLALQLTEAVRNLMSSAVHASNPRAETAPVVWFVDAPEARAELATRLVRGPPPREWFWRAVLPEVLDAPTVAGAVAALLEPPPPTGAGELPAIVQIARTLQVLLERGVIEAVLRHVPTSAAWSRPFRLAWGPPPRLLPVLPPARRTVPVAPRWLALLRRAVEEWTIGDVRTVWLATVAVVASRPELVASPETPRLALRAIAAAVEAARAARRPALAEAPAERPSRPPGPPETPRLATLPPDVRPPPTPTAPPAPLAAEPAPAAAPAPPRVAFREAEGPNPPREREPSPPPRWLEPSDLESLRVRLGLPPPLEAPAFTELGGLFFYVRPLYLLGLWETIEAEPALLDQAFGTRILDALLDRIGAPPDEPMRGAAVPHLEPEMLGDEDFVAPERWWEELCPEPQLFEHPGPGGLRLVRALAPGLWLARTSAPCRSLEAFLRGRTLAGGPPVDGATAWLARRDGWVSALVRWSNVFLGAEPAEIVRRPAIVAATRTHVDVVLPRSAIDMRVRRRALDADPGWVPWLGRIVMFHYVEDEDFDPPEPSR